MLNKCEFKIDKTYFIQFHKTNSIETLREKLDHTFLVQIMKNNESFSRSVKLQRIFYVRHLNSQLDALFGEH